MRSYILLILICFMGLIINTYSIISIFFYKTKSPLLFYYSKWYSKFKCLYYLVNQSGMRSYILFLLIYYMGLVINTYSILSNAIITFTYLVVTRLYYHLRRDKQTDIPGSRSPRCRARCFFFLFLINLSMILMITNARNRCTYIYNDKPYIIYFIFRSEPSDHNYK